MRRPAFLAASLLALAGSGCGSSSGPDTTPAACLAGPNVFVQALGAAPGDVRLAATTPISACLPEAQDPGDEARVGSALVRAATVLNAEARRDPGGGATVSLGYLVGAVSRAAPDGQGIHGELLRRLESAARFHPDGAPPAAFDAAYQRGYAAGHAGG